MSDGLRPGSTCAPWDFGYAPVPVTARDDDGEPVDVVLAMRDAVPVAAMIQALSAPAPDAMVEALMEEAPIFWYRARAHGRARRAEIGAALASRGLPVRYVASSRRPSVAVAPRLNPAGADPSGHTALPSGSTSAASRGAWPVRRRSRGVDLETPGRWFLRGGHGGVAVDRRLGTGAGTRLAVIDDDAAASHDLDLDREVLVLLDRAPRYHPHGALMVVWAVGTGRRPSDFRGVAPDASPRLYLIPKPGTSVLALPLAVVLAVRDGADVILCSTYVEGSTSPMLDDALDLAWRQGRGGRGVPVVLPTGREASSPAGSVHASFSLGFGEPASDPRVFCVGPSARGAGWFVWQDRLGRSRPFANRGPAIRWLAPGDDMTYPFRPLGGIGPASERLFHAESSGASAVAAGVLLLVLQQNPSLRVEEVDAIVTRTLDPVSSGPPPLAATLADPSDWLPARDDRDGHNAKHGYGRIHAGRASVAAADPIAFALVSIGEDAAASAWLRARRADPEVRRLYSRRLARWAVRALLAEASLLHGIAALLRHARLIHDRPERRRAHGHGAILRHLAVLIRSLSDGGSAKRRLAPRRAAIKTELAALCDRTERLSGAAPPVVARAEAAIADMVDAVFRGTAPPASSRASTAAE